MITSPLTQGKVKFLTTIEVSELINGYKNIFNIDITKYFNNISKLTKYECIDSGYQFFYPFNVSGDDIFYKHLQKFDWYYMPWKWEYEKALKYISSNMKVLEVGCAKGDFLLKLKNNLYAECVGLEFNKDAIETAKQKGINVLSESIEFHSVKNVNTYDIVCSFQVLEHISSVKKFIEAQIKCLKSGGILIISVPNNDSFIRFTAGTNLLNRPPHHMGLWKKKSLKSLNKYFPIKCLNVFYEPLQAYHKDLHATTLKNRICYFTKKRYIKLVYSFTPLFIQKVFEYIIFLVLKLWFRRGHTIFISFTKL